MTWRRLGRGAVVVVALAAIAWLAHGVRALSLRDKGRAEATAVGTRGDRAAAARALEAFRRAARLNADPGPELLEASLLLELGRHRRAAAVLERVVARNRGNLQAWTLLATATASFDTARSVQANEEFHSLYGDPAVADPTSPVLRTPEGRLVRVAPGRVDGSLDRLEVVDGEVAVSGWAANLDAGRPASAILVVSRGRVVFARPPTGDRPDIARLGDARSLTPSGFAFAIPRAAVRGRRGGLDVRVLAADGDVASMLRPDCRKARQELGC